MAAVKDLLRAEADGTLSFGDYTLASKTKLDGFEFQGDLYKVKTFKEITKLEKNGMFVYESVPGTAVEHFKMTEDVLSFEVSGAEDAQFTVEMWFWFGHRKHNQSLINICHRRANQLILPFQNFNDIPFFLCFI